MPEPTMSDLDTQALRAIREFEADGWYVNISSKPRLQPHTVMAQRMGDIGSTLVESADSWQEAIVKLHSYAKEREHL